MSVGGKPIDVLEEQLTGSYESDVIPTLIQTRDGDGNQIRREFEPLAVTRLGGTLPWDTQSKQLQCGETVTGSSGDMNIRLVYKAVCSHSQFKTLQLMRTTPEQIKLVSAAYSGPVTFDELKFDRIPDANGFIEQGENGSNNEPLYEVQLQSKENSDDNTLFDGE